jgi:hypothetical protein
MEIERDGKLVVVIRGTCCLRCGTLSVQSFDFTLATGEDAEQPSDRCSRDHLAPVVTGPSSVPARIPLRHKAFTRSCAHDLRKSG